MTYDGLGDQAHHEGYDDGGEFSPRVPPDPALAIPPIDIHDPYSSAVSSALMAIRVGITLEGSMNATEHADLLAIEEFIRVRANA